MELIRISSGKIKISLTKDELDAYDLNIERMDRGDIQSKAAFREIFIEAKEKTGFDADEEKVFVQIFRAKDGGCEIFVSKIGKSKEAEPENEFFVFRELGGLIRACTVLKNMGYEGISSAYTDEEEFFLVLSTPTELQSAAVCEHGERDFMPSAAYISEYLKHIRETDAVNILSQF